MAGNTKILEIDTRSRWNSEHYVGYVLEIINRYLSSGMEWYHLGGGGQNTSSTSALMVNGEEKRIKVTRIGECSYAIEDWPEDRDFEEFQREAKKLLEQILANQKT